MQVECINCGQWHRMTPTAMAVVVKAFQEGELHTVNGTIEPLCMLSAFNPDAIQYMKDRYPKHQIAWG